MSEMSGGELLVVATLRDELSAGLAAVRSELAGVAAGQERVAATSEAASAGLNRTGVAAEATGRKLTAADLATKNAAGSFRMLGVTVPKTAAALAVVAAGAVYMAARFETAMTRVNTQAGASLAEVHKMSGALLAMAPTVGITPERLAESLYHVESAGFRGATALDAVRASAHGAAIGNANLEDVTQAMIATLASGIGGVHGADDAMALLNRTVGIGDMKMQALAQAMATGILPSARSAGLQFEDVAAALATITDNATPANEAATRLRMTFALMASPTGRAIAALGSIGLTSTSLATDMRQPHGLLVALTDLQAHLAASGKSAVEQNAVIEHAFGGGRTSGAILTLLEEMGRLRSKYEELGTAAQRQAEFQAAWSTYTDTLSYKWHSFVAGLDVAAITIGSHLLPVAKDLLDVLTTTESTVGDVVGWLGRHQTAAMLLAVVIGGMLVPRMIALAGSIAQIIALNAGAAFMIIRASVAAAAEAFAAAGGGVRGMSAALVAMNINPVILGMTALAAVAVFFWQRQKAAADAAKASANDWLAHLGSSTSSLSDTEHAIDAITAKLGDTRSKMIDAAMNSSPSNRNVFLGTDSKGASDTKAYAAQIDVLTQARTKLLAQAGALRTNEATLAAAYGISGSQVEQLANRYGIDLSGALAVVGPKFDNVIASVRMSHDTNARAAADIAAMASSATSAADAVTALKDSLDALSGNAIAADEAAVAFRDKIVTLEKALKTSHGSMSMHNSATRAARQAFDEAIGGASQWATAVQTATGSTDKTAAALQSAIGFLTPFAHGNNYAAQQVAALKRELKLLQGQIDALHGKTIDVTVNSHGLVGGITPAARAHVPMGDTPGPRGDRFASAAGLHARLDGGIPGKRVVTSAVRSWGLGSPWSDHASGRAYDLIGSNLGSYAAAVRAAGAFAEFHGAGAGRHLHVAAGDTPGPRGGGVAGGNDGVTLVVQLQPGSVVVQGSNATPGEIEAAVARGAARGGRRAIERARVPHTRFGAH